MNLFNLQRAFEQKRARKYDRVYFAIDLHDTVIPGTYTRYNENRRIYPDCQRFFQWAKNRNDIVLILWTSSHRDSVDEVLHWLRLHGIEFDYINENPMEPSGALCDFSSKFYFSVLLDDKAGFDGEKDWTNIINELKRIGEWDDCDKLARSTKQFLEANPDFPPNET